jgi:holo-[acyl-carrier protein] synthase
MICGIGVDIVDVATFAECVSESGDDYLKRVFTSREIAYCDSVADSMESYAARLAAKEASMKALSTGWDRGVDWHDFEVLNEPTGQPTLYAHGKAAEFLKELTITKMWVSLSHIRGYAIAQVVFERCSGSDD